MQICCMWDYADFRPMTSLVCTFSKIEGIIVNSVYLGDIWLHQVGATYHHNEHFASTKSGKFNLEGPTPISEVTKVKEKSKGLKKSQDDITSLYFFVVTPESKVKRSKISCANRHVFSLTYAAHLSWKILHHCFLWPRTDVFRLNINKVLLTVLGRTISASLPVKDYIDSITNKIEKASQVLNFATRPARVSIPKKPLTYIEEWKHPSWTMPPQKSLPPNTLRIRCLGHTRPTPNHVIFALASSILQKNHAGGKRNSECQSLQPFSLLSHRR